MSKRNNLLLLEDIRESAIKIIKYTDSLIFEMFIINDKTVDAVIPNFEIIGEVSNRIDYEFKENNPKLPWNRMTGLRNRVIHEYFGIDYEIVWSIIENDIEDLPTQIEDMISDFT